MKSSHGIKKLYEGTRREYGMEEEFVLV